MDDLLLVLFAPIIIVLLGAIYQIWRAWLEHDPGCNHNWSRWTDPQPHMLATMQRRNCTKCNIHEQRMIQ